MGQAADFLAGVIEGFYGQPWTQSERFQLFDWMTVWGLNTYFYGPKDDLKHRAIWREPYSGAEATNLGALIAACKARGLRFIYALSPGLDIRFSDDADRLSLERRFEQMLDLGCEHFALLFDDVPDRMHPADLARWGSLAAAQSDAANRLFGWTRARSANGRFLFCPTPYCGRMAERKLGGEGYLSILGRELLPEIDVFWTGPEIISAEITVAHVNALGSQLRRKPLIWDNLHANDYDGRRFFCGPSSGRAPELRGAVRGLLVNPNNEFGLNFVPFHTLAQFVRCEGAWDPRAAYLFAMQEWLPSFSTIRQTASLEDLILFGDCYYLPYSDGPEAERFFALAESLLDSNSAGWADRAASFLAVAKRLSDFCSRTTELCERPLFYALSRRVWDLREELDLLVRYVQHRSGSRQPDAPFCSDFHLPGTYDGGLVARLHRLLVQQADGSFEPRSRGRGGKTSFPAQIQPA